MKIRLIRTLAGIGFILGSVAGATSAQAGVECRYGTEKGVPYVSVSAGNDYERIYFSSYSQRDAAKSRCLSLPRDCGMDTVEISNADSDRLGQPNTLSQVDRFVHGLTSDNYTSYERCLSGLFDEVVDEVGAMPGERGRPRSGSTVGWGLLPNGKPNPLSPINKL